jgi:hypothetical protein
MSTVRDPARLVVDASAPNSERELLRHGVDMAPPPGAEARVWKGLAGAIGAAALGGVAAADASTKTAAAATKVAGAGLTGAKVVAVAAVVAGFAAVGGYLLIAAGKPRPAAVVARAAVPPVPAPPPPPVPAIGATESPADAPPAAADELTPQPPPARKIAIHPARPGAASSSAGRLREETTMIRDARQALRQGDAARALRLLDECRRLFPGGVLQQERELLAIEALVKSGRTAQASARAAAFLRRYPDSPHAGEIRGLGLGTQAAR